MNQTKTQTINMDTCDRVLSIGIPALRYFCIEEADWCEEKVKSIKEGLSDPTKKKQMEAWIDGLGFYMSALWIQAVMSDNPKTNDEYFVEPSMAEKRYQEKLEKSLNRKEGRPAGFD